MKSDQPAGTPFPNAKEDLKHARHKQPDRQYRKQLSSSSYRLAYDDKAFILSDDMRAVRLLMELSKPELGLQKHGIEHTIVMFGSARTHDLDTAQANLHEAKQRLADAPGDSEAKRQLKRAKAAIQQAGYYQQALALAHRITSESGRDNTPRLHVITGGGPGIMEAANRGAFEAGGVSIGLNIVLPKEQYPNSYITPELCFRFHYFAMRKLHFLLRARALVVFPGGYGTLDELFETLTLVQTKKIKKLPILMFGREYWSRVIDFDFLLEQGMIELGDLDYFQYVDSADEAWQVIKDQIHVTVSEQHSEL